MNIRDLSNKFQIKLMTSRPARVLTGAVGGMGAGSVEGAVLDAFTGCNHVPGMGFMAWLWPVIGGGLAAGAQATLGNKTPQEVQEKMRELGMVDGFDQKRVDRKFEEIIKHNFGDEAQGGGHAEP